MEWVIWKVLMKWEKGGKEKGGKENEGKKTKKSNIGRKIEDGKYIYRKLEETPWGKLFDSGKLASTRNVMWPREMIK